MEIGVRVEILQQSKCISWAEVCSGSGALIECFSRHHRFPSQSRRPVDDMRAAAARGQSAAAFSLFWVAAVACSHTMVSLFRLSRELGEICRHFRATAKRKCRPYRGRQTNFPVGSLPEQGRGWRRGQGGGLHSHPQQSKRGPASTAHAEALPCFASVEACRSRMARWPARAMDTTCCEVAAAATRVVVTSLRPIRVVSMHPPPRAGDDQVRPLSAAGRQQHSIPA